MKVDFENECYAFQLKSFRKNQLDTDSRYSRGRKVLYSRCLLVVKTKIIVDGYHGKNNVSSFILFMLLRELREKLPCVWQNQVLNNFIFLLSIKIVIEKYQKSRCSHETIHVWESDSVRCEQTMTRKENKQKSDIILLVVSNDR